jgi:hypothetical protein
MQSELLTTFLRKEQTNAKCIFTSTSGHSHFPSIVCLTLTSLAPLVRSIVITCPNYSSHILLISSSRAEGFMSSVLRYGFQQTGRYINTHIQHIHTLSRVVVTYAWGFRSDDRIYCTLFIHNSRLQAIQHYRYSTHFPVHRCTRISVLGLY